MAFSIILNEQEYGLEKFIHASFTSPYLLRVQAFLYAWQQNEIFCFTSSGTTGLPKQFFFSKSQLMSSAQNTIKALQLQHKKEHILNCLDPKFVGGAMMLARALLLDCKISLFEPNRDILSLLSANHSYSLASFVPIQLQNLSEFTSVFEKINQVLLGGTTIQPTLKEQLIQVKNKVYHTFGMTETLSHVALMQLGVDPGYWAIEPNQISLNEHHQICIRTNLYEQEIITNDMAHWIDEKHFEWKGRLDFVINTGGVKVHPEFIENLIIQESILPATLSFCIAKAPHPIWQEQVVLVSSEMKAAQYLQPISSYLKGIGQSYAKPQRFIYLNPIPSNENGKIMRATLNQIIENERL